MFELRVGDESVIIKNVVRTKQQGPLDEFEALMLLRKLGIDAPQPLARVFTDGQQGFVVMEKIEGESGRAIKKFFERNNIDENNRREILRAAKQRMSEIAEIVKRDVGLDKPWRLKDFMIEFEQQGGHYTIKTMRPIDFERSTVFDPKHPHSVRLGQGFDRAT